MIQEQITYLRIEEHWLRISKSIDQNHGGYTGEHSLIVRRRGGGVGRRSTQWLDELAGVAGFLRSYTPALALARPGEAYLAKICHSMMLLKMVIMASSSKSLMVSMLKCRRKRDVTGLRPPPVPTHRCTSCMQVMNSRWARLTELTVRNMLPRPPTNNTLCGDPI